MNTKHVVSHLTKAAAITALLVMSSQASALVFANGGFEGYTGNKNVHNSAVPPGWTITGGTPDTFNASTNFAGYTWGPSSTGGDFLHGIGTEGGYQESAQQLALDGLVIGQSYEISFEQSISRSTWSRTGGFWRVFFGAESFDSDPMAIPDYNVFEGWNWQTMIFTATSTIQSLTVTAISDTLNQRSDIGIDSFYLGKPGQNPDNPDDPTQSVPEPSTLALLGLGLLGFASRRKLLKK